MSQTSMSPGERDCREGTAEDGGGTEQEDHDIFLLHVRNIPSSAVLRGKADRAPPHLHNRRVSFHIKIKSDKIRESRSHLYVVGFVM